LPQQADTLQLREVIQAYASTVPERDGQGRLKLTQDEKDLIAQLCDEIGQTQRPRRITFYSKHEKCLELSVADGRLYALRRGEGTEPIHCTAGTPEEAANVLKVMESALVGCGALSVEYNRMATELDRNGPGLFPDAILSARYKPEQVPRSGQRDDQGCAAELHIFQSVVTSTTGDLDRLSQLQRMVETNHPRAGAWLEEMNDEVFNRIEIGTGRGKTLRLNYEHDGVRLQLPRSSSDAEEESYR